MREKLHTHSHTNTHARRRRKGAAASGYMIDSVGYEYVRTVLLKNLRGEKSRLTTRYIMYSHVR